LSFTNHAALASSLSATPAIGSLILPVTYPAPFGMSRTTNAEPSYSVISITIGPCVVSSYQNIASPR
jgi:hypothetical protein